ncbi:MAG: hypothetical protein KatS3mg103_1119 [Phycisphaerales bacterium]|nr:MAG: hypothetical protein KatS3mg103_1119 [Phycisphaerales bacterium]
MTFTGKATFSAGSGLPELVEDVSDIIGIVSPFETPLLDHLGDPRRAATSTVHEWIEDELLPNTATVVAQAFSPTPLTDTTIDVDDGSRFRVGDLVRPGEGPEVMLVTGVAGDTITVVRGYGATDGVSLAENMVLTILGNAALEGADAPSARFTNRVRRANYTQIFTATVEVSGSMQAVRAHGIADELDYQKQERMRELLRDLENCVINGAAPVIDPQGSTSVRRSMNGIIHSLETNRFIPGIGPIPPGSGGGQNGLTEEVLNAALREVWEQASGPIDTIVCGGLQKRRINAFLSSSRRYGPGDDRYRDMVSVYESDFGVCRVVVSRWMPADSILLLDSSRIEVMPLEGRSFHYKPLASTGDSAIGQVIGEYTLELRNENAHGLLVGLATS